MNQPNKKPKTSSSTPLALFGIGFCGVDETVSVQDLVQLTAKYPWIEWGILFRVEKEGGPRFPSMKWVQELVALAKEKNCPMRLAAHLCSSRCEEVLHGDDTFVKELVGLGFQRVQVNATAANGVDTSNLKDCVDPLVKCINEVPELEWILQRNVETQPVWEPILAMEPPLKNVSALFDDSVGTGKVRKTFPSPKILNGVPPGYAGGIGPSNIVSILETMKDEIGHFFAEDPGLRSPWIDMESSLRSKTEDGKDVFSLENVQQCIDNALQLERDDKISVSN